MDADKPRAATLDWGQLLNSERPRPSTMAREHREEFERDYDRSVFSTPVKRLQDKAQVFPLERNDAVRTRLTHSLEVSCVARGLARAAATWLEQEGKITAGMDRQIEAIAATCGLIHDLGNPPFGHAGEEAIQGWFASGSAKVSISGLEEEQHRQDFLRFEGNAQTLRLISKLQVLADFNGLNLTFGTLSAACKYLPPSHEVKEKVQAWKKPGYFASEKTLVEEVRRKTGTGAVRNPITYLVEAADDIVYSVADIEDAIKKGIFSWRELQAALEASGAAAIGQILDTKEKILKAGRSEVPSDLPEDAHGAAFRTASIEFFVKGAIETFKEAYSQIMEGTYEGELVADPRTEEVMEALKKIGREQVYCTLATLKLEIMGRRIITDLLDVFWEGARVLPLEGNPKPKTFAGKVGVLLSPNYRKVFLDAAKSEGPPEIYHRFQLVTDYICGMTDSFAQRLHAELTNG